MAGLRTALTAIVDAARERDVDAVSDLLEEHLSDDAVAAAKRVRRGAERLRREADRRRFGNDVAYLEALVARAVAAGERSTP